jgi:hypothetical protein
MKSCKENGGKGAHVDVECEDLPAEDLDDGDSLPQYPLHEAVAVKKSSFGGSGLFALRDFAIGDALFEEAPFLSILNGVKWDWDDPEGSLSPENEGYKVVEAALQALSPEDQTSFWAFTQAPIYGEKKIPLGVFWTNTIHIYSPDPDDEYDERGRSCMFLTTCRLNHSCRPNVEWGFDHSTDKMTTYAVKNIREGDELFACYKTGGGHEMTLTKREYLKTWYGFDCMCAHCKAYLDRYSVPIVSGTILPNLVQ